MERGLGGAVDQWDVKGDGSWRCWLQKEKSQWWFHSEFSVYWIIFCISPSPKRIAYCILHIVFFHCNCIYLCLVLRVLYPVYVYNSVLYLLSLSLIVIFVFYSALYFILYFILPCISFCISFWTHFILSLITVFHCELHFVILSLIAVSICKYWCNFV